MVTHSTQSTLRPRESQHSALARSHRIIRMQRIDAGYCYTGRTFRGLCVRLSVGHKIGLSSRDAVWATDSHEPIQKKCTRWECISASPGEYDWTNDLCAAELSMGPFCVTRSNPTNQLTDPTQPNSLQVDKFGPNLIQLNATNIFNRLVQRDLI